MEQAAFTLDLPLFGHCNLMPHGLDEVPSGLFCYVSLEGREGTAALAIYRNGEFRDHQQKQFRSPVTRWFSVEKIDGTAVF